MRGIVRLRFDLRGKADNRNREAADPTTRRAQRIRRPRPIAPLSGRDQRPVCFALDERQRHRHTIALEVDQFRRPRLLQLEPSARRASVAADASAAQITMSMSRCSRLTRPIRKSTAQPPASQQESCRSSKPATASAITPICTSTAEGTRAPYFRSSDQQFRAEGTQTDAIVAINERRRMWRAEPVEERQARMSD